MNKGRKQPYEHGLSNVLGRDLKTPPPKSTNANAIRHTTKFVPVDDFPDSKVIDTDITLQKEHYGLPRSRDYTKNMFMATCPLAENIWCGLSQYFCQGIGRGHIFKSTYPTANLVGDLSCWGRSKTCEGRGFNR